MKIEWRVQNLEYESDSNIVSCHRYIALSALRRVQSSVMNYVIRQPELKGRKKIVQSDTWGSGESDTNWEMGPSVSKITEVSQRVNKMQLGPFFSKARVCCYE